MKLYIILYFEHRNYIYYIILNIEIIIILYYILNMKLYIILYYILNI